MNEAAKRKNKNMNQPKPAGSTQAIVAVVGQVGKSPCESTPHLRERGTQDMELRHSCSIVGR